MILYRGSMQFVNGKSPQNRSTIPPPLLIGPYVAANNTALLA